MDETCAPVLDWVGEMISIPRGGGLLQGWFGEISGLEDVKDSCEVVGGDGQMGVWVGGGTTAPSDRTIRMAGLTPAEAPDEPRPIGFDMELFADAPSGNTRNGRSGPEGSQIGRGTGKGADHESPRIWRYTDFG